MCRSEAEGGVCSASDFPCTGSVILFILLDANKGSRAGAASSASRLRLGTMAKRAGSAIIMRTVDIALAGGKKK